MNYEILWVNEGFHGVPVDSPSTPAAREAQGHEFPWPKWRKLVLVETMEIPMEIKSDRRKNGCIIQKKSHSHANLWQLSWITPNDLRCRVRTRIDPGNYGLGSIWLTLWISFKIYTSTALGAIGCHSITPIRKAFGLPSWDFLPYGCHMMSCQPHPHTTHTLFFSRKGVTTHKKRNMETCSNMFSLGIRTSSNYMWTYLIPTISESRGSKIVVTRKHVAFFWITDTQTVFLIYIYIYIYHISCYQYLN